MKELESKLKNCLRYKTSRFQLIKAGSESIYLTREEIHSLLKLIKPEKVTNKQKCHCGSMVPENGCGSMWCPGDSSN